MRDMQEHILSTAGDFLTIGSFHTAPFIMEALIMLPFLSGIMQTSFSVLLRQFQHVHHVGLV
jgi:hypothetical protein